VDGRDEEFGAFHCSACCCISLQPPLADINKPKAAAEVYHVAVTTSNHANRIDRRLEANIRKHGGGGSMAARGRCGGGGFIGVLYVASVQLEIAST
jgi:hypothetical protein